MEGYIILHKKLLEWQYYQNPNMVRLFLHLLLIADEKGNVSITLKVLTEQLGIPTQTVRTCIKNLAENGLINKETNKSVNKTSTLITICEYDSYINPQKRTNKTTNKSLTNPQANLDKRRNTFTEQLRPYVQIYGRDMVNEFWKYWTEPNKSKTRMRFELEKTWDLNLRLQRWASNNKMEKNGKNRPNTETKEQRAEKYARRIEELLAEDEGQATGEDDTE